MDETGGGFSTPRLQRNTIYQSPLHLTRLFATIFSALCNFEPPAND